MKTIISGLIASVLVMGSFSAQADEPYLIPLVPNHVGLTAKKYPSLCWMLPKRPPTAERITFTLRDDQSVKSILEAELLPSSILNAKQRTCHCVNLKEYDVQLEPNVQYKWFIAIIQSSESLSGDILAGGMIERCEFQDCMVFYESWGCNENEVISLARSGLWYDSISCICDLLKANPDNEKLRRILDRLMKDTGIILVDP